MTHLERTVLQGQGEGTEVLDYDQGLKPLVPEFSKKKLWVINISTNMSSKVDY